MQNISEKQMQIPFAFFSAKKSLKVQKLFSVFEKYFNTESFQVEFHDEFCRKFFCIGNKEYWLVILSFF